jgi:hypothetical protein
LHAQPTVTRPVVSGEACPLETIAPLARLEATARDLATGSRFLAAGYVFVAPTYRSRDVDLQTTDSIDDGLAVVEYLGTLPFVDRQSIVVGGCSGGGDLALQVASRTRVCAVVALKAFHDIDAFCRRHVRSKPKALDLDIVAFEPVRTGPVR